MAAKEFKKLKYHDVSYDFIKEVHRKPGRPAKDLGMQEYRYMVELKPAVNHENITHAIDKACCFVLCSNDINMCGQKMLQEYKTQDCVEKKFQQLKSPQFVNTIYLESPQRIEALLATEGTKVPTNTGKYLYSR